MFVHNVESTTEPEVVNLPSSVGNFNTNVGLVNNADGSRIFFIANETEAYRDMFCMLDTLTSEVTILLYTLSSDPIVEEPQDIATDSTGSYLYFNETDNGFGTGDLWRIEVNGGGIPEMVLDTDTIAHPSGGVGKFIDQFDVSDDGQTIAFFIAGWINGEESDTYDKELFVKTALSTRFLTNNDQNAKTDVVLSDDASTIVYTENNAWMVTTPSAVVEAQTHIESGYISCGDRPGITVPFLVDPLLKGLLHVMGILSKQMVALGLWLNRIK